MTLGVWKFVSEKILDRKIFEIRNKFWVCKNEKYFGPQTGQKNPFGPKESNQRLAVATLESILDGDNCHQGKCCIVLCQQWLCDSCPKILLLLIKSVCQISYP